MINWNSLTADEQASALARPAMSVNQGLTETVYGIIERVGVEGDSALLALTKQFDGAALEQIAVPIDASLLQNADVKAAIDTAYTNVRTFHKAQMPTDVVLETQPGVECALRYRAIAKVGLYIPGGSAPLPSTVLMLGVCAQLAGAKEVVLCTPCNAQGEVAAEIHYAASLCGIRTIYRVGGAQAVAAMALGTQSIPKVDKIFGPGNAYVTEAKQQVTMLPQGPAIDMPAGPSEVLVIADGNANPAFVAADLLSQAEHGPDSQTILVTPSAALAEQVQAEVDKQLALLPRKDIAAKAMGHSRLIVCDSMQQAIEVSNTYGPEHLIVQTDDANDVAAQLDNAGSVFIGAYTPESAGDYASGTNHVLPTYGHSRVYSSLGLLDFLRRFTEQRISKAGLQGLAPALVALSGAEGLDAHQRAVTIRLENGDD